jgi:hypothetical protein
MVLQQTLSSTGRRSERRWESWILLHMSEIISLLPTRISPRGLMRPWSGGRVRRGGQACYHVDEISADPLPSGHTSRRWGTAIKRPDGPVSLDPDPWPDT